MQETNAIAIYFLQEDKHDGEDIRGQAQNTMAGKDR
jgi:hypothetical protein